MMDADLNKVPAKTISLKRTADSNLPLRFYDAELKNKRRERFAPDATLKTKVSKVANDSELQQKRLIRFSENSTKVSVSPTKQNSSEALKQRQIRFSESSTKHINIQGKDLIDSLKKRRERFGEVTSTLLKKIEVKEKVLQRKARFGPKEVEITTQTNGNTKSQKKKIVF